MKHAKLIALAISLLLVLVACQGAQVEEPADVEEAAAGYEVVWNVPLTTDSDEARSHFMKGVEAADLGRGAESREHFLAAVAADPGFASGYLAAAFSANSFGEFVENLNRAVEHAEGASEVERAWIMSAQKNFENDEEGALAEAEKAARLAPESPRTRLLVAGAHGALGNYEAQREVAWKVTEDVPGHLPAYLQLANSYLFNEPRDFAKAEECARKMVELAPDEQSSHDILGDVHRAQGDLEAARDDYTKAAELAPENGSPLQQRGHVNSFLGNWEEARADYDRAMELSEPQVAATFGVWRALVAVHEGKPEEAVAEFEERLAGLDAMGLGDPLSPKINYLGNIIAIASHHGMHDKAAEAIARSQELRMERLARTGAEENRSNEEAAVVFAEGMLAARRGDYDAARTKAQQYMEIRSADTDPQKDEQAHEILGLAALLEGKHEEAIEHYEQTSKANPYAKYHLALACEAAGDTERAPELFADLAAYNFNLVGYALVRADVLERTES